MTTTNSMKAISIPQPGGPEVLTLTDEPRPQPGAGDLLIRVAAAGVNRPDCLQRSGNYPVPPDASPLPGLEVAGLIDDVGANVTGFAPGDRVAALVHGGGYAEYCLADASHALAVPDGVALDVAAALPETLFTVYYNVVMRGALKSGETLLVHGGSSGIGTTAIQLAKAMDAEVVTTAGSDTKCRYCEELGADVVINYREQDFFTTVRETVGNVDVVLDMVGGDYIQKNLDLLARDGRYLFIAFLGGSTAEVNFLNVLRNRLTVTGSTLRPQSREEKAAIASSIRANAWPLLESATLAPPIYARFALQDAAKAHALMESSEHTGKIVLVVDESLMRTG